MSDGRVFCWIWFTTTTGAFSWQWKLLQCDYGTKIPIFSVGDDDFPFRQCCIKPYSRKILIDEEILFSYCLSRKRRVTENGFEIWINRFRIFVNRTTLTPDTASVAVVDISEDSNRIIKFWSLADNNLCLNCKIQSSL